MFMNSKLALIAAVAALGIASPALAQSSTAGDTHNPNGAKVIRAAPARNHQIGERRTKLYDSARVPSQGDSSSAFPALRMDRENF
jgi:hypothetical protein